MIYFRWSAQRFFNMFCGRAKNNIYLLNDCHDFCMLEKISRILKRKTRARISAAQRAKKAHKIFSLDAIKMLLNVVIDTMFFWMSTASKNQLNLPSEAERASDTSGRANCLNVISFTREKKNWFRSNAWRHWIVGLVMGWMRWSVAIGF